MLESQCDVALWHSCNSTGVGSSCSNSDKHHYCKIVKSCYFWDLRSCGVGGGGEGGGGREDS